MPITDGLLYRLKPQTGHTAPHNEIGGGNILSGGTIALVDVGAGRMAWRFTGAQSSAAAPTKLFSGLSDGTGYTVAITLRRATLQPTPTEFIGYSNAAKTEGFVVQNGSTVADAMHLRSQAQNQLFTSFGSVPTSTLQTYVHRLTAPIGPEIAHGWVQTVGRIGTAADVTSITDTLATATLNTLWVDPVGGGDLYIVDYVLWNRELTDAECASVADNLRGVLDAPAAATSLTGPSTGLVAVASSNFSASINGTVTGTLTVTPDDAGGGGTFTPTSLALSTATQSGTFTYTPASLGAKTINISNSGGLATASLAYTATSSADATAPIMNGALSASAISASGFTLTWLAASDNVAVTGYEVSTDAGVSYASVGNVLTTALSALSASTAYSVRLRAFDAAGNRAATPLTATVTTAAAGGTGTITSPVLKNNTGMVLANEAGVSANVYNAATGALVVRKTGLSSSAGGVVTISDALIVAGSTYAYEIVLAANGRRLPLGVAA